jgi:uncharacterized 2Fe-2S/4Fe-4S cluster protein (DUF4445 family)
MMNRLWVKKIDKVILAGAFGSYIDKMSAASSAFSLIATRKTSTRSATPPGTARVWLYSI